jgi:hypothetical protein
MYLIIALGQMMVVRGLGLEEERDRDATLTTSH